MTRPKADLTALALPKGEPPQAPAPTEATPATVATAGPAPSPPPASDPKGYAHTLSLRLTAEQYRRLRRYVASEEDRTGRRVTHQGVIELALAEFLDARGG
nr:hypothetical protein [uncultured Rhodopila sp.]